MKDSRFCSGVIFSAVWIVFAFCMFFSHTKPIELNAWGDFFAGFSAPLAFLWLVLGYMQQGEELKQSTKALELQAAELKNSVDQQSQLVAVSREQMQQELRSLEEERERRRDAARPKFVLQANGNNRSGSVTEHLITVANVGNTATKLYPSSEPPVGTINQQNRAILPKDGTFNLSFRDIIYGQLYVVTIQYIDADGLPGEVYFTLQYDDISNVDIGDVKLKS